MRALHPTSIDARHRTSDAAPRPAARGRSRCPARGATAHAARDLDERLSLSSRLASMRRFERLHEQMVVAAFVGVAATTVAVATVMVCGTTHLLG